MLYNALWVSAIHPHQSAIRIHISPPSEPPSHPPPSHLSRPSQNTRLSSLHVTFEVFIDHMLYFYNIITNTILKISLPTCSGACMPQPESLVQQKILRDATKT